MKNRFRRIFLLVFLTVLVAGLAAAFRLNAHADIDEWSSRLIPENITLAEFSKGYGVEQCNYTLPKEFYGELVEILRNVTEKNSSRAETERRLEEGYRLAFFYEEKLWLFKCCENQIVSLTFADKETGAYYGCEGKLLYINSPELWNYIRNSVDQYGKP